ncbi:uncharacterized protein EDB91DRAFT_242715 [Suillus paluster]|uniref:uncharacterized protein n=1 Tax=Suillus paluster TaxID=48578 RepID=UPI001B866E1F|nr:uncharacterized protein EDB91DRAFT_242715 [Suillus paluster]KAG1743336.1 hypothetical protein EDB91DRAFT_242715 [Suillus paluster]
MSTPYSNATRQLKDARRPPPGFFNDVQDGVHSSAMRRIHLRSSAGDHAFASSLANPRALLGHFSTLLCFSHSDTNEATELQQHPRRTFFLVAVLLSLKLRFLQYRKNGHCLLLRVVTSRNEHSSKAKSRRRHRNLSLPPLRHPQQSLLLLPVLPRRIQHARCHDSSRCGLVSCFFSAVHIPRTPTVINSDSMRPTTLSFLLYLPLLGLLQRYAVKHPRKWLLEKCPWGGNTKVISSRSCHPGAVSIIPVS